MKSLFILIFAAYSTINGMLQYPPVSHYEEERIYQLTTLYHLKRTNNHLAPYIREELREVNHNRIINVNHLRQICAMYESNEIPSEHQEQVCKYAHDIVMDAMEKAYNDKVKESQGKVSKRTTALISGGAAIITALISAGVTLTIHFTTC